MTEPENDAGAAGITRGELLKAAAVAGSALLYGGHTTAAGARARPRREGRWGRGHERDLFITDQERAIQHFPPGWSKQNLPGMTRLQRHGLTFENAFTNACMCSPARSTLVTRLLPRPARRQVHARGGHAGATSTRRSSSRSTSRTSPR